MKIEKLNDCLSFASVHVQKKWNDFFHYLFLALRSIKLI